MCTPCTHCAVSERPCERGKERSVAASITATATYCSSAPTTRPSSIVPLYNNILIVVPRLAGRPVAYP